MKDLLYLKDEQIKEFIQLLFYAYKETITDPKEVLSKKYFGTGFCINKKLKQKYLYQVSNSKCADL